MLDILEDFLSYRQIGCYRLDGQTPVEDRNKFMRQFNSEDNQEIKVFVLTTRAGGLGVNLTAASIVVLLDSDWNPQMDLQAMDRAHRIGQTKDVYVYRLITKDTIEEKIIERQVMKLKYDFILLEKGRTERRKKKNFQFSLNKLCDDEIKDLAYFGVSNILKVNDDNTIGPENLDLDKLLAEGEQNSEMLNKVLEDKIKEFGEKALEFRSENNYMNFTHDFGHEENRRLTLEEMQAEYLQKDRMENDLKDRELLANDLNYFLQYVPKPHPHQFFQDPTTLLNLRCKRERLLFCQRAGIKVPEDYKLSREEKDQLEALELSGFGYWSKSDNETFIVYSGKYGRLQIEDISSHFMSKSTDEVYRYACVFWSRLSELGDDLSLKVLNYIELREYKQYVRYTLAYQVDDALIRYL